MRWLLLACLTLLVPALACAKDVSLAWDPNTEPDIAGYKIYYQVDSPTLPYDGTGALEGASPVDVGLTTAATLHGLAESRIYYFTVTAYNSDGYESSFSNLVASDWVPEAIEPLAEAVVASRWFKFSWTDPPAGFNGTFTLYYGIDPQLVGAPPLPPTSSRSTFSGPSAPVAPLLALLLTAALLVRRRPTPRRACALLVAGLFLASCGGGGGSDSPVVGIVPTTPAGDSGSSSGDDSPAISDSDDSGSGGGSIPIVTQVVAGLQQSYYEPTDLRPGTTYYWKVVAEDGTTSRHSQTYRFTVE